MTDAERLLLLGEWPVDAAFALEDALREVLGDETVDRHFRDAEGSFLEGCVILYAQKGKLTSLGPLKCELLHRTSEMLKKKYPQEIDSVDYDDWKLSGPPEE